MQKLIPDFGKLKDLARKNFVLIIILFLACPVVFLFLYFLFPGNYTSSFKIQLRTSLPHLVLKDEPVDVFRQGLNDPDLFSEDEIDYFNDHIEYKNEGNRVLSVTVSDSSSSRLQKMAARAVDTLRERFGKISPEEKESHRKELQELIASQKQEKEKLEENLKKVESAETEKERDTIRSEIEQIDEAITPKQKQLSIIQDKIAAGSLKNRTVFETKANELRAEIDRLAARKDELEQKLFGFEKGSGQIKDTLKRIVELENSIEKNSKRLAFLMETNPGETGNIKVPYFFGIQLLEPPTKSFKVYTGARAKRTVFIGLLFAVFLILLVFIYNTSFDQVISSVDELEEITDYPVIGAIYEIKR